MKYILRMSKPDKLRGAEQMRFTKPGDSVGNLRRK